MNTAFVDNLRKELVLLTVDERAVDPLILTLVESMLSNLERGLISQDEMTQMAFDPRKHDRLRNIPTILECLASHDREFKIFEQRAKERLGI